MAVKVMQGITRYIGTAAEIAAYDISKANIGSTFFESDTGILKIVNQAGVLVNAPSESVGLSGSNLRETQVGTDQDLTWANSDAANTQKTYTFTQPPGPISKYQLAVYNPSTVTDLTVKVFNVESSLASGTRDAFVTMFTVPKAQSFTGTTINTYVEILEGIFNSGSVKIVASNDTILGGSDGFTTTIRLRELM